MSFNIVLIEPEIPNNTGNIGRLSLAAGCNLHLVKPFGFDISDSRVKRAGLDYWQHLRLHTYENQESFFDKNKHARFAFFSSKATKSHWELNYEKDHFLIFGKESVGLPEQLVQSNLTSTYKIPMHNKHIRSLNLANAVSIVVYHGLYDLHHKQ